MILVAIFCCPQFSNPFLVSLFLFKKKTELLRGLGLPMVKAGCLLILRSPELLEPCGLLRHGWPSLSKVG